MRPKSRIQQLEDNLRVVIKDDPAICYYGLLGRLIAEEQLATKILPSLQATLSWARKRLHWVVTHNLGAD